MAKEKKNSGRRKYRILKGNFHSKVRLMEPELALEQKPKGTKSKRRESETGNLGRRAADGLKEWQGLCGSTE